MSKIIMKDMYNNTSIFYGNSMDQLFRTVFDHMIMDQGIIDQFTDEDYEQMDSTLPLLEELHPSKLYNISLHDLLD